VEAVECLIEIVNQNPAAAMLELQSGEERFAPNSSA
jgi:hypothetical protein